jgi:N-acetylglutamate synthase-like GNAT family acetyltransferase
MECGVNTVQLRRGGEPDRQALYELLANYQMEADLDPAEFLVAEINGTLVGAARLEWENQIAYLRPVLVASKWQAKGIGRTLVQALAEGLPASLNVVARGEAARFYGRLGFLPIPWEQVPDHYQEECALCPDRGACCPIPMVLMPDHSG